MLIDMHAHILPGADHGSDGIKCSLSQVNAAIECGIGAIVATPHFYLHSDNLPDFIERRQSTYDELMGAMDDEMKSKIRIFRGAEVTMQMGLSDTPNLEKLCIEGTNYILIEMPIGTVWTEWVYNELFEIEARFGLRIIIAHIDRYEHANLPELLDMEFETQINASSLACFGHGFIMKLVKGGYVQFLGSDVHNADAPQYKQYKKALKVLGNYAETMMENAANILGIGDR